MAKVASNINPVLNEARMAIGDEARAVAFWERYRWNDTPACVHCGDVDVYQMRNRQGERDARWRWRCRGCGKQYSVRVGTVMEGSNLPFRHWTLALWLWCSSKKGFASKQFQRMTGCSYKSALFVSHRLRFAMADEFPVPMDGTIEVDETYVGGKPKKITKGQKEKALAEGKPIPKNKRGRGTSKIPVVVIVQRGGRVTASPVANVTAANLQTAIRMHVDPKARICTDDFSLYRGIGKHFEGGHYTVNHTADEFGRREEDGTVTHTNTAEGFNSLLKRGIFGIHHSVSPRHLHRYVSEAAWKYSERFCDDGERMLRLVSRIEGKRLANRKSAAI